MSDLENYFEVHVRPPEFVPCILSPPLSWQGSDYGYTEKPFKNFKNHKQDNSLEY